MPEVSVIIPLYNKGPYIARTLDSVFKQTFGDFEIVVVDDGSTDNGVEIVQGFPDPRIRLIQQENQGVSAARNRGIEAATGKLISFLDADDEWLPTFLETVMYLHKKYPQAGMLIAGHYELGLAGTNDKPKYSPILDTDWDGILPSYFKSVTFDHYFACTGSICVPKEVLEKIGLFKTGVTWGEDEDLWGRIALKYPAAFSSKLGALIHFIDSDLNRLKVRMVDTRIHPFITEGQNSISQKQVPDSMVDDLREYIALLQIRSAVHNMDVGDRILARALLKSCETTSFKKDKLWLCAWSFVPSKIYSLDILVKFRELLLALIKRLSQ